MACPSVRIICLLRRLLQCCSRTEINAKRKKYIYVQYDDMLIYSQVLKTSILANFLQLLDFQLGVICKED